MNGSRYMQVAKFFFRASEFLNHLDRIKENTGAVVSRFLAQNPLESLQPV